MGGNLKKNKIIVHYLQCVSLTSNLSRAAAAGVLLHMKPVSVRNLYSILSLQFTKESQVLTASF